MSHDPKRPPAQVWLTLGAAAAAMVVLGSGGVIVALNAPQTAPSAPAPSAPEPHGPPEPSPTLVAWREAGDLRKLAKADCDTEQWHECIGKLDKAAELDPQGNLSRPVQRMRLKATRAQMPDPSPGAERRARDLDARARAKIARTLHGDGGSAGLRVQLVCAAGAEPARLCDELAASMKQAGWAVARSALPASPDAPALCAQRIEVAEDGDEVTQAAADALAQALTVAGIVPRGPDDMTLAPGAPTLRVTVGER